MAAPTADITIPTQLTPETPPFPAYTTHEPYRFRLGVAARIREYCRAQGKRIPHAIMRVVLHLSDTAYQAGTATISEPGEVTAKRCQCSRRTVSRAMRLMEKAMGKDCVVPRYSRRIAGAKVQLPHRITFDLTPRYKGEAEEAERKERAAAEDRRTARIMDQIHEAQAVQAERQESEETLQAIIQLTKADQAAQKAAVDDEDDDPKDDDRQPKGADEHDDEGDQAPAPEQATAPETLAKRVSGGDGTEGGYRQEVHHLSTSVSVCGALRAPHRTAQRSIGSRSGASAPETVAGMETPHSTWSMTMQVVNAMNSAAPPGMYFLAGDRSPRVFRALAAQQPKRIVRLDDGGIELWSGAVHIGTYRPKISWTT